MSKAQRELVEGMTGGDDGGDDGDDDEEEAMEFLHIAEDVTYLVPLLRILALLHTFTAFGIMVAYYCLKVCSLITVDSFSVHSLLTI